MVYVREGREGGGGGEGLPLGHPIREETSLVWSGKHVVVVFSCSGTLSPVNAIVINKERCDKQADLRMLFMLIFN